MKAMKRLVKPLCTQCIKDGELASGRRVCERVAGARASGEWWVCKREASQVRDRNSNMLHFKCYKKNILFDIFMVSGSRG